MSFVFKMNCLSVSTSILSYTIQEMLYALPTVDIKYEKTTLKRNSYLFTISPQYYLLKKICVSITQWTHAVQTQVVEASYVYEKMNVSWNYFDNHFTRYVNHTIMLNDLNLYSNICQLFPKKTGGQSYDRAPKTERIWMKNCVCVF